VEGPIAQKGRRSSLRMEIGPRCLPSLPASLPRLPPPPLSLSSSPLLFACWTQARPLRVSQMISNITVKLRRRCSGSIRVRFAARSSSCFPMPSGPGREKTSRAGVTVPDNASREWGKMRMLSRYRNRITYVYAAIRIPCRLRFHFRAVVA